MLDDIMQELVRNSPYLAAVIIVVVYFIRAMENQRAVFNSMMTERDRLFDESLKRRDEIFQASMERLASSINGMENTMIQLDSDARNTMGLKNKPLKRRKKSPVT